MYQSMNEFLLKNKDRYEIISSFQHQLNYLTESKYQETVQFVEDHSEFFFKDHESAIFFFLNLIHFSISNFKQFEYILDVGIHFSNELRSVNVTDNDIISIGNRFMNSINYLFFKNFISIESIILQSNYFPYLFIMFFPEIEKYDQEYAELRISTFFDGNRNQFLLPYYKSIKSNQMQHIENRNRNYHPSLLHKSIREDDIDAFQKIISQNNYDINYIFDFSYYERARSQKLESLSMIQIAAQYGSIKIFKFLWMQNNIVINENLLSYSFDGRNHEIIHICETKCKLSNAFYAAICTYQNDLINYCIDNYQDQIFEEDNKVVKEALTDFDVSDDNPFLKLNYHALLVATSVYNLDIIIPSLSKIFFIVKNVEENIHPENFESITILNCINFDVEMFKFLYSNKNQNFDFKGNNMNPYINAAYNGACDSVIYIMKNESPLNLYKLFCIFITYNYKLAISILNMQKMEKDESNEHKLYCCFIKKLQFDDFLLAIDYYYEEIVVKMILFYFFIDNEENQIEFIDLSLENISKKMIVSLVKKLSTKISKELFEQLITNYSKNGFNNIREFL